MTRLSIAIALIMGVATTLRAQNVTRPEREWRTVETQHFRIHYTTEHDAWTRDLASRIESVRDAVSALVGFTPARKVTVVVDDPLNAPNGLALAFIDAPVIYLFPTPPSPAWSIGNYRDWAELLAVHEFGHIAHLNRPSRNPWERRLWSILPLRFGPIPRRAPRWAVEGYATLIEGRLTGSGRPYGVWRPAILRQWAIEGRLPKYAELGALGDFRSGEMPYLVGSAFLEWLVARHGDSSLVHLWRRLSARQPRGFSHAFAGVFRAPPDELYGRFAAELTAQAVAIEQAAGAPGGDAGELVQRYTWETGSPALSRDGSLLALVREARERPSRLIVMETRDDTALARRVREARERLLRKDPEDVPDIPWQPLPKKVVATLHPVGGRAHAEPRFFADGERLLVVRYEALPDGGRRRDLFIWHMRRGSLRRVTRGAGIMRADPSPDGRTAAAERCANGRCDLVIVDLESGAIRPLRAGTNTLSYYRPRFSPDGRLVAVSEHLDGRWRVVLVPVDGGSTRAYDPADGANRYDAAFLHDGSLALVSEKNGVPNVVRVRLEDPSGERPLTNVTGAALAPEPAPDGSVFFLRLHSRGLDLNRTFSDRVVANTIRADGESSLVVARAPVPADTFARAEVAPSREYGLGPRGFRVLPGTQSSAGGQGAFLSAGNFDPVGRFTLLAQGALGTAAMWRGGSLRAAYRRHALAWRAELFGAGERPSRQEPDDIAPEGLDADYWGGALIAEWIRDLGDRSTELRLGGSGARVVPPDGDDAARVLGFADIAHARLQTYDELWTSQAFRVHGATGRSGGERWARARASASFAIGWLKRGVRGEVEYARTGENVPHSERIAIGGGGPLLFDHALLSQRIAMPALPLGIALGRHGLTYRASGSSGIVEVYLWGGSTDASLDEWHRVVGVETREMTAAIPFARIPELRISTGVGYSLDEPYRRRLRGYGELILRP